MTGLQRVCAVLFGCAVATLVAPSFDGASADAAPRYRMINLSALGYPSMDVARINDAGQVVGEVWEGLPLNRRSAFLYDDGVVTLLPSTLGGPDAEGYDVNEHGHVVGGAEVPREEANISQHHAFLWQNGVMQDLGVLSTGRYSFAYALNDAGIVVGSAQRAKNYYGVRAFVRRNGVNTDLGSLAPNSDSVAFDVNEHGVIVGVAGEPPSDPYFHKRAVRWQNGAIRNLGTLGGDYSMARAINDAGVIVGVASDAVGGTYAFRWEAGVMTSLGALGGEDSDAWGINERGEVVGSASTSPSTAFGVGFYWVNGRMYDLEQLLVPAQPATLTINDARDINNRGEIVANSNVGALLLVPLCGDGTLDPGEQCDDGNRDDGDCCTITCDFAPAGSPCPADDAICSTSACDGAGSCVHAPGAAGTTCRAAAGECDLAETCSGESTECPPDLRVASGTACAPDAELCTADVCDGTNAACTHPAGNTGVTCRAAAPGAVCDVAEACDGVTPGCPPDGFAGSEVECRGAAGECDVAERCDGSGPGCPADVRATGGTACAPDAERCTTDVCDGTSVACTHPPGNAGAECRAVAPGGVCDVAERCDGVSPACPADRFAGAEKECRGAAGECDVAERCDGRAATCPADGFAPSTRGCRSAQGECDRAESCSGTSPHCPADGLLPAGTACTADAETCTADVCDGTRVACTHPAGNAGALCRAAAPDDPCDLAEHCDGLVASCPVDDGQPDRDADGECDARDPCTNVAGAQDLVALPRAKLVLSRLGGDPARRDDALALSATFDLPDGFTFAALDPAREGVRVVLESATGRALDVTLPAGALAPGLLRGWKRAGSGRTWTFSDRSAMPAGGIVKLKLTDRGRGATARRVSVVVTGRNARYPIARGDEPVQAILALGDAAAAAAGRCGESRFAARDCRFDARATTLSCTR
jgi:probable HAF family extracellular repeat protein/cysteine-rich repeat protein